MHASELCPLWPHFVSCGLVPVLYLVLSAMCTLCALILITHVGDVSSISRVGNSKQHALSWQCRLHVRVCEHACGTSDALLYASCVTDVTPSRLSRLQSALFPVLSLLCSLRELHLLPQSGQLVALLSGSTFCAHLLWMPFLRVCLAHVLAFWSFAHAHVRNMRSFCEYSACMHLWPLLHARFCASLSTSDAPVYALSAARLSLYVVSCHAQGSNNHPVLQALSCFKPARTTMLYSFTTYSACFVHPSTLCAESAHTQMLLRALLLCLASYRIELILLSVHRLSSKAAGSLFVHLSVLPTHFAFRTAFMCILLRPLVLMESRPRGSVGEWFCVGLPSI